MRAEENNDCKTNSKEGKDKVKAFKKFIAEHGGKTHNVQIAELEYEKGWGILAAQKIEPNTVIMEIPQILTITAEIARNCPTLGPILNLIDVDEIPEEKEKEEDNNLAKDGIQKDSINEGMENQEQIENLKLSDTMTLCKSDTLALILFILHHSSIQDSPYSPYLYMLPQRFHTPLFWKSNDIELLRQCDNVCPIIDRMDENRSLLYEFWNQIFVPLYNHFGDALLSQENAGFDRFLWAYTIIESRTFKVHMTSSPSSTSSSISSLKKIQVLCPFIDFINHTSHNPNVHLQGYNSNDGRFRLITHGETIRAGTEFLLTYNQFNNQQLIRYYGFAIPCNPHDKIILSIDDILDLKTNKSKDTQSHHYNHQSYELQRSDPSIPSSLISVLRKIFSQSLEFSNSTKNMDEEKSITLNERIFEYLTNKIQNLLNIRYSTMEHLRLIRNPHVKAMITILNQEEIDILRKSQEYLNFLFR